MTLQRKLFALFLLLAGINAGFAFWLFASAAGGSGLPDSDLAAASRAAPHFAMYFLAGALAQAVLAFLCVQRFLFSPLDQLAAAANTMACDQPAVLDIDRNDEIGLVANAVNHMAEKVRATNLHAENDTQRAVSAIESAAREQAFIDRLRAAGRVAVDAAQRINGPLGDAKRLTEYLRDAAAVPATTMQETARSSLSFLDRIGQVIASLVEASRKGSEPRGIGLCDPLRQVVGLFENRMAKQNITVKLELDGQAGKADPVRVLADPQDMCHVFYNLIENALDAMPKGGMLTVRAQSVYSWAVIEIIDSGIGLTMDEVAASFDYFHTSKPMGKGHGLGLPIARHIVLSYNGSLTLNSQKGEGTRAAVELPLKQSKTSVRQRPATRLLNV